MATLIVVGFKKDLYRASEVLNELIDRGYEWTTDLDDAVAAYRDYNGKLRIDSSFQMTAGEDGAPDRLLRSLVGLTLGAVNEPLIAGTDADAAATKVAAGTLSGGAHGTLGGRLDARWWKEDFGIPDGFVQEVGALVQPGDSAIYALLRTADPTMAEGRFRDYGGVVMSITLSPEQERKLQPERGGKNYLDVAGKYPQIEKEKGMTTWTEMEKQVELEMRAWAQALDEMEAEEAAYDAELDAKIKAAQPNAKAKLQAQAAKMHADSTARRSKLQKDINALKDKVKATAARLDAETDKAVGKAKAELKGQQAQARADREKVNAQFKADYEADMKQLQQDMNALSDEINAAAADLERAMAELRQGHDKAVADLEEGYEKAKTELK